MILIWMVLQDQILMRTVETQRILLVLLELGSMVIFLGVSSPDHDDWSTVADDKASV